MRILEQKAAKQQAMAANTGIRFVASSSNPAKTGETAKAQNTDEINLDDDESGDDEPIGIQKQSVPGAVFGKLEDE